MKPVTVIVAALVCGVSAPAFACDKDAEASFPMKATAFQQKVDAKAAKVRARTAERIKESGATTEQAKQERARIETVLASIQAAARKATADGVVTAEEAQTVRAAGRDLHKKKDKSRLPKA